MNIQGGHTILVPKPKRDEDDDWTVECADVTACSRAQKGKVIVPYSLWRKWIDLAGAVRTEWLAYLRGRVEGDTVVLDADGMYFPPQDVRSAHVNSVSDVPEYQVLPNTVAAIHSHVGMEAIFSTTDRASANWPLELVVNNRGNYQATLRMPLPCGAMMRCEALIELTDAPELPIAALNEAIEKGKKPAPVREYSPAYQGASYLQHFNDSVGERTKLSKKERKRLKREREELRKALEEAYQEEGRKNGEATNADTLREIREAYLLMGDGWDDETFPLSYGNEKGEE